MNGLLRKSTLNNNLYYNRVNTWNKTAIKKNTNLNNITDNNNKNHEQCK